LRKKIQGVLFPTIELEYGDFCKTRGLEPENRKAWQKWVNAKCDVLALWSRIWYNGDVFVTRDENFHKKTKKPQLIKLGAKKILRPTETVGLFVNTECPFYASLRAHHIFDCSFYKQRVGDQKRHRYETVSTTCLSRSHGESGLFSFSLPYLVEMGHATKVFV